MSPFLTQLTMMPSTEVSHSHTPFRYTTVQLQLPSRRVLMSQRCHHVVMEFLPLRLLGRLLP